MRAYSSMPFQDLIDQIRDIAIKAKASPLVIYKLDEFIEAPTEDEIEAQCQEARDDGIDEGRNTEWEICFGALEAGLELIIGVGPERGAILQILTAIDPR